MSGPGHAAPPPPPGPFVLRAAAPAGEARGGAGRGRRPSPAAFFVRGPGPRRCPPATPSAARGTKGRAKGAPRGRGAGALPSRNSTRSPGLGGPRPFYKGESRCGESLRWVGAVYTKQEAREIGRPGAETSAPGRLPVQSRLARPPFGAPRPPAGLRGMESGPRGRWVGGHGTPAPPAGRGLGARPQRARRGRREMFDGIWSVG